MRDDTHFDLAIIGGGVVGCAIARQLTLDGARVILLEKGHDILSGASKANSAILHTGYDAPQDSLELSCIQAGYAEYMEIHKRLNLPLLKTGAFVVAWNSQEQSRLDGIVAQAHRNGVTDVTLLTDEALRAAVPGLSDTAVAGVQVPGEHVIDPWSAPLAYLLQAMANGAQVRLGAEVKDGILHNGTWTLDTSRGAVRARCVINAAGLFGDIVEARLLDRHDFEIRPTKGQFVVLDKAARRHLSSIILPVPSAETKGIVLCPTIFGNVLVGPTAEPQTDRTRATVEGDTLLNLRERAAQIMPVMAEMPVTACYAGLRPATEQKAYRIKLHGDRNWISVGGIRSTGLSAALGIARHVAGLHAEMGDRLVPIPDPVWPQVPNLAEHRPRDWQNPGHGKMLCHCELVTQREVEAALVGPLPAGTLGGLKRRTRATMGRCQGFYCTGKLAALLQGHLQEPMDKGMVKR